MRYYHILTHFYLFYTPDATSSRTKFTLSAASELFYNNHINTGFLRIFMQLRSIIGRKYTQSER